MRNVSAALRRAIDAGERVVVPRLTIDWDNDGVLTSLDDMSRHVGPVSVDQQLETNLPAQVRVVPGAAVAQLDTTLERGNTVRYAIPVAYQSVNSFASGTAGTFTVPAPPGLREGEVVLVAIFYSGHSDMDLPRSTNVNWATLAYRSDASAGGTLEGRLLTRRASATEPSDYIFTFGAVARPVVAISVRVGDPNITGVTDYASKGIDTNDVAVTSINVGPVRAYGSSSTVVSFFAAQAATVTSVGFTPLDGDIEQLETGTTTGALNVRAAVMTQDGITTGRYLKRATITGGVDVRNTLGFTVTLSGRLAGDEAQHAAWTFSELNEASPYAGKIRFGRDIRYAVGFATDDGIEYVPVFTGLTLSNDGDSRSAQVSISALDNRERMKNSGKGELIAAVWPVIIDTDGNPLMPGLEATWIVSKMFAFAFQVDTGQTITQPEDYGPLVGAGYFASPPPRSSTIIWLPFHGSAVPFIGSPIWAFMTSVIGNNDIVSFSVGPYVAATAPVPGVSGQLSVGASADTSIVSFFSNVRQFHGRVEFWARFTRGEGVVYVYTRNARTGYDMQLAAYLTYGGTFDGQLFRQTPSITRDIVGPSVPADSNWHFYGLHIDSTTGQAHFRIDGVTTTVAFATFADGVGPPDDGQVAQIFVFANDGAQVSDMYISGGILTSQSTSTTVTLVTPTTPWIYENFTRTAFIDKSENLLSVFPAIDDTTDSFQVVSALADAEFAAAYFDADGYPHYRTSRSDVTPTGQTVQKMIETRKSLKNISYVSGANQVANVISVGYSPFSALTGNLWQASGVIRVPALSTVEIRVSASGPIFAVGALTFTANRNPDGTGAVATGSVTGFATSNITNITITFTNTSSLDAYLVNGSGSADATLVGTWIAPSNESATPVVVRSSTSIRKYREQPLRVDASTWRQTATAAAGIAALLIADLADPRPVIRNAPIKGDPSLELGDLTTVRDVEGLGINGNFRLTGLAHKQDDDFSQTTTLRQASVVARWGVNYWNDGSVWGVVS